MALTLYTWNRSLSDDPNDETLKGGNLLAQHEALTRMYALQQEGIYPTFLNEFNTTYAGLTVTFESGCMSVFGYFVENDGVMQENMRLSDSGVQNGSIGIRIDLLNNRATLYNYLGEFTLQKDNLNTNYLDGIYEYELVSYRADEMSIIDFNETGSLNFFRTLDGSMMNKIYPIGSIYLTTNTANPGALIGGTWERWGNGRVPVSLDEGQTEFNSVGKTGGHKSLQSHTHTFSATTNTMGDHKHYVTGDKDAMLAEVDRCWSLRSTGYSSSPGGANINAATSVTGKHTHTISGTTAGAGSGNAQNLMPYIVCYMWRRIG